jgi:hypothetical protein
MEIDINKANSKEVRNMVRKILKSKFGMFYTLYFIEKDVKGTQIPYKNWDKQKKYDVKNWPSDVAFEIKNEE